jgi:hypothetical protein
MRYLIFYPTEPGHYKVLYDGLISSDRGVSGVEARVVARLLSRLEAIGKPSDSSNGIVFMMGDRPQVMALEDVEYRLMKELLDNVRFIPKFARQVAAALDWFDAAPNAVPTHLDEPGGESSGVHSGALARIGALRDIPSDVDKPATSLFPAGHDNRIRPSVDSRQLAIEFAGANPNEALGNPDE